MRFYSGADTYTELPDFEASDYELVEQFGWPLKTPDNVLEQEKLFNRSRALDVRSSALEAAEQLKQKDGSRRDFSDHKNSVTLVPSFLEKLEPGAMRGEAQFESESGRPLILRAVDGSHESFGIVTDKEAGTVSYFTAGYMVVEDSKNGTLSLSKQRRMG